MSGLDFQKVMITGGAGFVGSNVACSLKRTFPSLRVIVADNLKRRGSEINLSRLQAFGVEFQHTDIRCHEDLEAWPDFDLLIDCAAEPSVQAGLVESPRFVLNTNLSGTIECLEAARKRGAAMMLLSTSRVYPIAPLNSLSFIEDETRFRWKFEESTPGFSTRGIAESFPLVGAKSFYGASKLACELIVQEYVFSYGMRAIINRCGVLAGPWQMSRVDQGIVGLWVARHYFQQPLRYMGFGGYGKQVRDVLHIDDLFDLVTRQLQTPTAWDGRIYNLGGGPEVSLSLLELTSLCQKITGHKIDIAPVPQSSPVDVRIYLSDTRQVERDFGWRPTRSTEQIVLDVHQWINAHHDLLATVLR